MCDMGYHDATRYITPSLTANVIFLYKTTIYFSNISPKIFQNNIYYKNHQPLQAITPHQQQSFRAKWLSIAKFCLFLLFEILHSEE